MTDLQKAILALFNECVEKQDCDVHDAMPITNGRNVIFKELGDDNE